MRTEDFLTSYYENYDEEGNWDGGYTIDMSITGGVRKDRGDQRHSLELKKAACENHRSLGMTYVNFDLMQMGLGCVDSWGAWPLYEHLVVPQEYTFRFVIRPVNN